MHKSPENKRESKKQFEMSKQLSPLEQKELAEQRAAQRAKLREAYQRIYNNPFRTNAAIFDPAAFRYEAARAFMREYYKLTPKSLAIPIGLGLFTWFVQRQYNKEFRAKENAIQSGQLTYYERAMWRAKNIF